MKNSNIKLILLRHGESIWNKKNLFTGWVDVPLSENGVKEAISAGEEIKNIPIDIVFTSTLVRAHMTLFLAMMKHSSNKVCQFLHKDKKHKDWGKIFSNKTKKEVLPVYSSWHLNERMYGKLQGCNKDEMRKKYGKEKVKIFRRSFDTAPPSGESLKMTSQRTLPYFKKEIVPHLKKKKNVLISAHGNSLRSIVMFLDKLNKEEVVKLEIPTGKPIIYSYDKGLWKKIKSF